MMENYEWMSKYSEKFTTCIKTLTHEYIFLRKKFHSFMTANLTSNLSCTLLPCSFVQFCVAPAVFYYNTDKYFRSSQTPALATNIMWT